MEGEIAPASGRSLAECLEANANPTRRRAEGNLDGTGPPEPAPPAGSTGRGPAKDRLVVFFRLFELSMLDQESKVLRGVG